MFWKLALPMLLAWSLCITADCKKARGPQGSIPSPYKLKDNSLLVPQPPALLQPMGKPEVLASSREALVVTERKYLRSDWCKQWLTYLQTHTVDFDTLYPTGEQPQV